MFLQKVKYAFFPKDFLTMSMAKKVAYIGVFIALSIVVNVFSIDVTPTMKISFNYLFGFFSGFIFGPLIGFVICFAGDFLSFLINPSGMYWFLTGISTGLLAFIPGLVMNGLNFKFKGNVYVKAVISVLLMYLLVTCGFGAMSNWLYVKMVIFAGRTYSKTFFVYLSGKIVLSSIVSAVNYALVFILLPLLDGIKFIEKKIKK